MWPNLLHWDDYSLLVVRFAYTPPIVLGLLGSSFGAGNSLYADK